MGKDDVFELAGLCLLALFGYAVWPPLCLLVFGLGALVAAWAANGSPRPRRREAARS